MTTSKVKSVQGAGVWDSQHGTLYKFDYEMEDGTSLRALHKSKEAAFKPGDEVEYEITKTHAEYGNSGKVRKPNSFTGGGKFDSKGIEIGHAINNGVQLAIADLDLTIENIEKRARQIYALAQKMKGEEQPKEQPKPQNAPIEKPKQMGNIEQNFQQEAMQQLNNQLEDDLPF